MIKISDSIFKCSDLRNIQHVQKITGKNKPEKINIELSNGKKYEIVDCNFDIFNEILKRLNTIDP